MTKNNTSERESITFYRNWWDAISRIDEPSERCALYEAILRYSFDGLEPEPNTLGKMGGVVWSLMFQVLKKSRVKFLNGSKSQGAPKGNKNRQKSWAIPTQAEVDEYFESNDFTADPDAFISRNEADGWVGARKHFKSWKDAANRWEALEQEYN